MNRNDISSSPQHGQVFKVRRRPSIHSNENNTSKFNDSDKSIMGREFYTDVSNNEEYENNDISINNTSKNTTQRSNKSHKSTYVNDSLRINDFTTDEDDILSSDEEDVDHNSKNVEKSISSGKKLFSVSNITENANYSTKAAEEGAKGFQSTYFIVGLFLSLLCLAPYVLDIYSNNAMAEIPNFDHIQKSFHLEDDEIYTTFKSGLSEVLTQNRPSTFIYLYEKKNEKPVDELVTKLGKYAVSYLKNYDENPIVLTAEDLNSPQVLKDYGYVLDAYTSKLEQVGVMIVKHLENVRGISAQSFHSFCDQDNPSVEQSLFIFTMEVEGLPKRSLEFIEQYFKNKWSDIKPDAYQALITRMSNMVHNVSFL